MEGVEILGDRGAGRAFEEALAGGRFLFSLVMSYTATCEIPGITVAGASPELMRYTPPADAELIHYGYCRSIEGVPATPDGRPTPALLTKAALESASIPHVAVCAGSAVRPMMPYMETGLPPGRSIAEGPAMSEADFLRAVDYGRIIGRTLSAVADCLVVGESVPGGTTTAQAVLRGMGIDARVSSSMPENPAGLKGRVVASALEWAPAGDPFAVAAALGDPMIPVAAGMAAAASRSSRVLLAGGTQMAAVLCVASRLGLDAGRAAVGTTSYVARDPSADLESAVAQAADVPVLAVDPLLGRSSAPGLRAFAEGHAKEGAGAGGGVIAARLRAGTGPEGMLALAEAEYRRVVTSR